jgi:RNA polymerase sigma factor (sigma-70 family)
MEQRLGDSSELDAGFEELVRSYGRLIRAAISRVAGPEAERLGPDVEQRLLTELWKRYRRDDVIRHPSSYLYRAAVRETVRALRAEARAAESALDAEPAALTRDDPHTRMEGNELAATLDEELDALLPERARAVRYHLAGFPVNEIMDLHGWSYSKARNLIARGLADLRQRLRRRGIDGR